MKIHLYPEFAEEDNGDGGIRRVVEAQLKSLPRHHIEFVTDPADADVIACHIQIPPQYLARFHEIPIVAHCHGLYWSEYEWESWAYKANQTVLDALKVADAVTAPTEWVAQILRRHTSADVRVIPHGVSTRDWQPPSIDKVRGYVLWNKTRVDPICTPEALDLLAGYMPDVPFCSTFGRERENVTLTGRQPFEAAKQIVRHAGAYLCTTRETFGIGTLEAMAAGVPVVGYNFAGQAEFIEQGVNGWLVEPGDIRGLADGVRWALANRQEAGAAARETAKLYTWDSAIEMYRDLYREVVRKAEIAAVSPRVSIVVPAYNLEAYLPDTLRSIQQQTDKDWECIVVNDASPDRCGEIADEFAATDQRFKVIHNPTNLYLAGSRNVAVEQAKGRYVIACDADDMLPPQTVETLANALDADRTLHVAYGGVMFTDEDGKTPTNYGVSGVTPGHSNWPFEWDASKQLDGYNLLPYSSMFRRTAWERVGGYRTRLKTAEDADFWTRLASFGFKFERVTTADMLTYRNREASMSRSNRANEKDYQRWFPWMRDKTLTPAGAAGDHAVSLLTPRVSVIIPVGPGHATFVQDAVDSVMAQSYRQWECIVVNDSGEPLRLPTWAKVIECDARDAGTARNMGIAESTTKLFVPLDADDYFQPDALQWFLTAYAEQGEGDRIIYSDFMEDPDQRGEFRPYLCSDWSCDVYRTEGIVHAVTALTPKSVWERVGGFATGIAWEDLDFQLRCAEIGVCWTHLVAPLFNYRKWTGKRRDYGDTEELARRKTEMVERWGPYLLEGKDFMACGCATARIDPALQNPGMMTEMRTSAAQNGDAILIRYTGLRAAGASYRGPSGTIYTFSTNEAVKWVAGEDAAHFLQHRDFARGEAQNEPQLAV